MVTPVNEHIDFVKEEENILQLWTKLKAFETCLKQSEGKSRYVFFDGPPFATGLPHYGHILAGTIKDIIPRWAHMSGYHVERRFGWDCHGLPIEYEIDKTLGIKGPDDVHKMGIEAYNAECRKIVMRYSGEWRKTITRMGRWIDFDNDYKTLYPSFMESVWWVFKTLYNKGLVYRGSKVMPYSNTCNTPLSNFESGQNYKEVIDPAIIVSFPLEESPDVSVIAWTTTPWTLPSNLAVCVHPDYDYVKVKDNGTNQVYIMMEIRLDALFKKPEEYTVLDKFKGKVLEHKSYIPLFTYFDYMKKRGAFRIYCDNYVTQDAGTGVVQQAPYFGEEDYRIALANGVISKDDPLICPLDPSGRFVEPVTDFIGQYVKDADKNIIKYLKDNGRLIHQGTVKHSYPFCWRSETPLIYRAVPSWFVRVDGDALLRSNQHTYWVPEFVKEKRFGNWLRDARDWAISRNRYWGTPIPLWMSDDGEEIICVGSIKELAELSGQNVSDLHREVVDKIMIPSQMGKGQLKRVSEVFDCWFESGSMPYAQAHYPFENRRQFEENFPADFIAEGIDQTRGWFYTLLVLSTSLFGKPPFKNLICNGLVLASDGQKMSKSKRNFPDPMEIVNKYGADALRLYLINSPTVRAENLRFREDGVRDVLKDVFLPWYNAYRFLVQNIQWYEKETGETFVFDITKLSRSENIMDKWILSFTQSLIRFVKQEMNAYRLYTVVPRLIKFVDNLTNWYVRMNRRRLKGDGGKSDSRDALETLCSVLLSMIEVMAPFTPFLTELMYQNLKNIIKSDSKQSLDSVHYHMIPSVQDSLIHEDVERQVSAMQTVVELGRVIRDRNTLPLKYPLPDVVVISKDTTVLNDIQTLERYILEELNVKALTVTTEKEKYGIQLKAEPDIRALGIRLRNASKDVIQAIRALTDADLHSYQKDPNSFEVKGHKLEDGELRVRYRFGGDLESELSDSYDADCEGNLLVLLNVKPNESMRDEGTAREIINRIQKLRKKAKLVPSDPVTVYYDVKSGGELEKVIKEYFEFICNALKAPLKSVPLSKDLSIVIEEKQELKSEKFDIIIVKKMDSESRTLTNDIKVTKISSEEQPFCKYVNIELYSNNGTLHKKATVLLENPVGDYLQNTEELMRNACVALGQHSKLTLYKSKNRGDKLELSSLNGLSELNRCTLFAYTD